MLGVRDQEPQCQTHPLSRPPQGQRGTTNHSVMEKVQGPPSPQGFSKALQAKTLGPTLPLPSAFTSSHPSAPHTALHSHRPASWGLTLTIVWPLRVPSQGVWCHKAGDWGPQGPVSDSNCHQVATRAYKCAAAHSWRENWQGLPSPRQPSKAPRTKTLGPSAPSPAPLPQPAPLLPKKPLPWACRPPGG